MNDCAICQKPLTPETDSKEHLFPNAIGGRRKVTNFICRDCNSAAGELWDAELARQMNPVCLLLTITRERGEPPAQEFPSTGGQSYVHHADRNLTLPKPTFKETVGTSGTKIHITARNEKELRKMLVGVKKKYPHLDEAAILNQAVTEAHYPKDLLHVSLHFEGVVAGRSIVKTALAFAVCSGVAAAQCELACEYLRDATTPPRWHFYPFDPIQSRPPTVALHCVAVQNKSGKLVAYVEYFGFRRMWVPLSDRYTGPDIQTCYAIDPVKNEELKLTISDLPSDAPEWSHSTLLKQAEASLNAVLAPAVEAAKKRELDRVVDAAWLRVCENMKLNPEEPIPPERRWQFSTLMAKEMIPFLEHQLHDPFANFHPPS